MRLGLGHSRDRSSCQDSEPRAMNRTQDFHGSLTSIFWFACGVFVSAMAIAHGAAVLQQGLAPVRDDFYYLVIFTVYVCIFLLTPALCFHIFSRSDTPNSYWRAFWTFAYLALLVHLYWAVSATCAGDWHLVFNSKV